MKTSPYVTVQGLLGTPPLIILYKGRRLAGALNSVQFNSIQLKFNSNRARIGNGCLSWLRSRKNPRKWLLELASIAKCSKTIRKMERADVKIARKMEKAAVKIVGFDLEKMERVAVRKLLVI